MAPQHAVAVPVQRTDAVVCATCSQLVSTNEVFDSWEFTTDREACPRCGGVLLGTIVL